MLLPALPRAWAAGGSVSGLRLRGGCELDLSWKDGRVLRVAIRSHHDAALRIRVPGAEPVALPVHAEPIYACGPELRFSAVGRGMCSGDGRTASDVCLWVEIASSTPVGVPKAMQP